MAFYCVDPVSRQPWTLNKEILDDDNRRPTIGYSYEVLTEKQALEFMQKEINRVLKHFQLPPKIVKILLFYYQWNREKLITRLHGNQEKLFADAHVVDPSYKASTPLFSDVRKLISADISVSGKINPYHASSCVTCEEELRDGSILLMTTEKTGCSCCQKDVQENLLTGLDCGHQFCAECWDLYLTDKVHEGKSWNIPCMCCEILVTDEFAMGLIKDSDVKKKYTSQYCKSFVEMSPFLRYCPRPDCTNIIQVDFPDAAPIRCTCNQLFCSSCLQNWHDPVKCNLLKKWLDKCEERTKIFGPSWDDELVIRWCPKCKTRMFKTTGYNIVPCINKNCKETICWICSLTFDDHAEMHCNVPKEKTSGQMKVACELAKEDKLFQFFYERYKLQEISMEMEENLDEIAQDVADWMQDHGFSYMEVKFLKRAMEVLSQCRQTLMYSYVFAYYLQDCRQKIQFQNNQRYLEAVTEALSLFLQKEIYMEDVDSVKTITQSQYLVCEDTRKTLLDHIHEGYEISWWRFR